MKKRLLGILLVLAVIAAFFAVNANAEDIDFSSGESVTATCQHCKTPATWLPLTQEVLDSWFVESSSGDYLNFPNTDHHYYVSEETVTVKGYLSLSTNESLCLHLNGNIFRRNSARPINLSKNATLNLMDHAANEGEVQGYANTTSTGCVIRVASTGAKVNMYGGTVRMLQGSASYAQKGGCLYLVDGSTFNMYGGVVTDGVASGGGNLYIESGAEANLLGGTIAGGKSNSSSGGNINNAGTLTVDGGTITGGSGSYGGNIRSSGTLNLLSGTVIGGSCTNDGGNVHSDGIIKLGACVIENGKASRYGDNIRLDKTAQLTVLSTFAGLTTINMNAAHLPETLEGGYLLDTQDSCEGPFTGKLYVQGTEQLVRLQGKEGDTKLYTVIEEEDFSGTGDMVAKCQHCATQVVWRPLTSDVWSGWDITANSKNDPNYDPADGTHYYLAEESTNFTGTLTVASGEQLCLHLNGNTFAGRSTRSFDINGTFNLMDHAANEGVLYSMAGSGTAGAVIRMNGTFNMYGGHVQMRKGAYERSGNGAVLYIGASDTFNMYGGTISGGVGQYGGNIYAASGATCNLVGGTVSGGEAIEYKSGDELSGGYGGNIYCAGTLTLGDVTVTGGTAQYNGSDIWLYSSGKLVVKSNFAGETKIALNSAHLPDPILGGTLTDTLDSCEGPFPGKLYLENSSLLPALCGKDGETKLYVADTYLVKKDKTTVWYGSAAEAMAAYDDTTAYMGTGAAELVVDGGAYTIDLAGADLTVSGTGTVTFFDSANKDGETYGTATVTGVTVANTDRTEVAGTDYYMIQEGNTYSFHCITLGLLGANIRPSSSGMYYTGTWSCDDLMKTKVESYGVAVSLVGVPTETFQEDGCLATEYGADTLVSGTPKTGVIIKGILNENLQASRNNTNARMPIYAAAYMKLWDGTVLIGKPTGNYSLYSAISYLDKLIGQEDATALQYLGDARAFYEKWKFNGMGNWELNNIPALPAGEDGVLNLLMVGNSFCYYYVEELYELLMETPPQGITEVNIYNLYYSGCRLNQHLDWWRADLAKYEFYKTDANGRNLLGEKGQWTLEQALVMENWDYISLQGMPSDNTSYPKAEETGMHLRVAELAEPLLDRFHELHPEAQLLWHRTWYFEIGRVSNGYTYTEEYGVGYNTGMQFVCDYMCNEWDQDKPYDLIQVNSGDAWTKVRATEGVNDLLPFGGLCARLGLSDYGKNLAGYTGTTANSGDGYHDGDIGGGQMVNAYAWYETLTGKDCRETVYRPTYTRSGTTYRLSEDLVKILQDAVHSVVPTMPETVKPAG